MMLLTQYQNYSYQFYHCSTIASVVDKSNHFFVNPWIKFLFSLDLEDFLDLLDLTEVAGLVEVVA